MKEAPLEKFQYWLQDQGVPELEAMWLARIWAQVAERLMSPVGMGAEKDDESNEIWIHLLVPTKEYSVKFLLDELKEMEDPITTMTDAVRHELLAAE